MRMSKKGRKEGKKALLEGQKYAAATHTVHILGAALISTKYNENIFGKPEHQKIRGKLLNNSCQ